MDQQRLIRFVERLIRTSQRKVFLILDNLRVHHGKLVAAWLKRSTEKIEVFFLPPYAPEYNPDEYLNHALKISVHSGQLPYTTEDISTRFSLSCGNCSIIPLAPLGSSTILCFPIFPCKSNTTIYGKCFRYLCDNIILNQCKSMVPVLTKMI